MKIVRFSWGTRLLRKLICSETHGKNHERAAHGRRLHQLQSPAKHKRRGSKRNRRHAVICCDLQCSDSPTGQCVGFSEREPNHETRPWSSQQAARARAPSTGTSRAPPCRRVLLLSPYPLVERPAGCKPYRHDARQARRYPGLTAGASAGEHRTHLPLEQQATEGERPNSISILRTILLLMMLPTVQCLTPPVLSAN